MKKIRHIIGAVLLPLGILLCLGAIGQLDFLTERSALGSSDMRGAAIKSIVGIVLMGVAAYLDHDMEFEEK